MPDLLYVTAQIWHQLLLPKACSSPVKSGSKVACVMMAWNANGDYKVECRALEDQTANISTGLADF